MANVAGGSGRLVQKSGNNSTTNNDDLPGVVGGPLASEGLGLSSNGSRPGCGRQLDIKFRNAYHSSSSRSLATATVPPDLDVFLNGKSMIKIHKDIFIAMSDVFEEHLDKMGTINGSGKPTVKLVDIEADVFKIIKQFCYTGNIREIQQHPVDKKLKLLETSIQFNIDLLIPYVKNAITESMIPADACKILNVARSLEITELETQALGLIWNNADHVLNQDEFATLGFFDAERILSSDSLMCSSELVVYNAALRWATKQANPSKNFKKALRYNFGKIMTCIRFANMTAADFSHVVQNAPSDFMSSADIIQLFIHISLKPHKNHPLPGKFICTTRNLPTQSEVAFSTVFTQTEHDQDSIIMPSPMKPSALKKTDSKKLRGSVGKGSVVSFAIPPTSIYEASTYDDDDNDDGLFYNFNVINVKDKYFDTFEDVIRKYYRKEDRGSLGAFRFEKVSCENIYRPLVVTNCKDVSIDVNYNYISSGARERCELFLEFIKLFDPLRYMVFYTKLSKRMNLGELMTSGLEKLLLRFNGVTFLESLSNNSEIVMNYMRDSRKILRLDKLKLTKLAMSNCEFSMKDIKEKGQLKSLILYRSWGDYSMDEIIKDFRELEVLVCWKHVPKEWSKISTNFSKSICLNISNLGLARDTLRKLVLFEAELKFPSRCTYTLSNLSELFLDKCYYAFTGQRGKISETFPSVFPNLQKLMINECKDDPPKESNNQFYCANSSFLNCVVGSIKTIQWIRVIGMKWGLDFGSDVEDSDTEFTNFLSKDINILTKTCNYLLEKREGIWNGKNLDDDATQTTDLDGGYWTQMDQMEYDWYELSNFYASCEIFEDYFLQGNGDKNSRDNFPQPILWC